MRIRVKICGITRVEDAQDAVSCGADAVGLVFYPDSPRFVSLEQARSIVGVVAPFVTVVGLFVNPDPEQVQDVISNVPLGLLQFHGQETNAECKAYGLPFIKSIAMHEGTDSQAVMESYPDAAGFLLDAWQPQTHGGSGITFDWRQVPENPPAPLILAGGLTPENINAAIKAVSPYAVDVSSGVESAKGIKSADKMLAFMKGVQDCGTNTHGS
jgi:phosphoribosylanthranilate isomerase